uniref:Putative conserved secreted protein n=1 Tax=Nyssomyia neivai TaxID=330878 RepID=A0A1L8DPI0_9DIPT
MRSFITVLALLCLIIGVSVIRSVDSACGTCGALSSASCVSETTFNVCSNGVAQTAVLIGCPSGTVCMDQQGICVAGGVPDCVICATCNAQGFACQSNNTFSLCSTVGVPSNSIYTCPANQICNYNGVSPNFCTVDDGTITTCNPLPPVATTTTTQPTTTTISPANWCAKQNTVGRYPVASDTQCLSYYNCFANNGAISGAVYTCQGITIFNPTLQQCVNPTTYQCPA